MREGTARFLRAPRVIWGAALLSFAAAAAMSAAFAKPLPVPFQSEYQAETWGLEEGFPENSCSGIVEGPDGYLWMGTFRGLVRFNGQQFASWAPDALPFLKTTAIINMYRDRQRRIWISTVEGLVMTDGQTWRLWKDEAGWGDRNDYVRSYAETAGGGLVLARFTGKVFRYRDGSFEELPAPPGAGGAFCAYDGEGVLHAVRAGFAGYFDGRAWQRLQNAGPFAGQAIGCGQTQKGEVILFTRTDLLRARGGVMRERIPLSSGITPFWHLAEDVTGAFWLPAVDSGVYRVRGDGAVKHFLKPDGLAHSGATRVVHTSSDGSIWIGSGVGGFSRFRPMRFRYLGEVEGIGDREVLTLAPLPDNRLLITPYGQGLIYFDGLGTTQPAEAGGDASLQIRTVLRGADGAIWCGGFSKGLMRLEAGRLRPEATDIFGTNETVSTLFEDSARRVWVGGDLHVAVREQGVFRRVEFSPELEKRRPNLFAERRDGSVLIAKHNELYAYGLDGLREQPLVKLPPEVRIASVTVDRDDRIWIGTAGHGLAVFHLGQTAWLTTEKGLPGATISSLIQDNGGRLWFGSRRNIIRADPEDLWRAAVQRDHLPQLQTFDRDDGLRDLDFPYHTQPTVAKDDRGRLWFALIRGAALIDPAGLTLNDRPPRVVVETISYVAPGSRQPVERTIQNLSTVPALPAGSRSIRIRYAALDFVAPRKQRFRVRLDGDGAWQEMREESVVSFLELPPGEHTLQIQAAGGDGMWNRTGATLRFTIAPYYWQTGWFRTLLGGSFILAVGGTAWLLAHFRIQREKEKLDRERRLAEAQARLALVLENTSDFVQFADAKGRLIYVNRAGRALVGLPADAPLGTMAAADLLTPAAQEAFTRTALPVALRKGTWSGESTIRHRDGREIPVSQVLLAHHAPDGSLDFTSTIARDISVAKRHSVLQEALRGLATTLTEALDPEGLGRTVAGACRKLFSHEAFFLVLVDRHGAITRNAYMEDTPPGATEPKAFPAIARSLSSQMDRVLKGSPLLVNREPEQTVVANTGTPGAFAPWGSERRSMSLMYAPILREGRVIGIVSVQSYMPHRYRQDDLVELQTLANQCGAAIGRIEAENYLRENEERLRLAMQTARMGSWEIDLPTGRLLASSEAEAVYGYEPGTFSGPSAALAARVLEPEATELRLLLGDLLTGRTTELTHIHRIALPDGTERWLEVKGYRQAAEGDDRIFGLSADITTRRLAELDRGKLEEQLRQAHKLEAVGTLAGGIAHDFNNILTAILGNTELARLEVPALHPTVEFLERIKVSGLRARDLVRRILAFSRPQQADRKVTTLQPVVEEVIKLLRSTIPAGVELRFTAQVATPRVEVDSTEIHQVLLNLGTNAWHALGDRPGWIEFTLEPYALEAGQLKPHSDLAPGQYARIAVTDNGKGIPSEALPRIFDPFFTTKAPGEGTGLGLSVAHGIVRASGGAIVVSSTVGVGTRFELYFPAASAAAAASPTAPQPAAPSTPAHGERVLFVDDEDALVLIADRMLTRAGFVVTGCTRPATALEMFRANPRGFDIVVSDLSMPQMSGLALAKELRQLRADIPIVVVSGHVRPADIVTAQAVGVNELLEKLNTPEGLVPIMVRLLRQAATAPRRTAPPFTWTTTRR